MNFTQRSIDTLKATGQRQRYADPKNKSLLVIVTPAGARSYVFTYRDADGKIRNVKIGSCEATTLTLARKEAVRLKAQVESGKDVRLEKEKRRKERVKATAAREKTISDLYDTWRQSAHWKGLRESTRRSYDESFRIHILPAVGKKLPSELTRRVVSDLIEKLALEKSDYVSIHAKAALGTFGNLLVEKEYWEFNIANMVKHKGKRRVRERVLDDHELKLFWQYLHTNRRLDQSTRDLLLVCLLCVPRVTEMASARVNWLNLEERRIVFPEEAMKRKREYEIPLSRMALEILDRRISSGVTRNGWLFPKPKADGPMTKDVSKTCARFATEYDLESFGVHDFRRTFATRMADQGHSELIIEKCLSHSDNKGKAIANYNHAPYRSQKRALLNAWEHEILTVAGDSARQGDLFGV